MLGTAPSGEICAFSGDHPTPGAGIGPIHRVIFPARSIIALVHIILASALYLSYYGSVYVVDRE